MYPSRSWFVEVFASESLQSRNANHNDIFCFSSTTDDGLYYSLGMGGVISLMASEGKWHPFAAGTALTSQLP